MVLILTWPGVAAAIDCSPDTDSFMDWERCWSGKRLLLCGGMVLLWLFSAWRFCRQLDLGREAAPWPSQAFWRSIALFWFLTCTLFVGLFAGVSTELRGDWASFHPERRLMNRHWLSAVILLLVGMVPRPWRCTTSAILHGGTWPL